MVKPKKPEIGVLPLNSKSNEKLRAKSQRQSNVNGASQSKIPNAQNLLRERSSIIRIGNEVIFLHK
jgi:hypothetical protein